MTVCFIRNVYELTVTRVLEVPPNIVEDMKGIKENTNNMVEDIKGIKKNTNDLREFVADKLTEHFSDMSKKFDQIFPQTEESNVQVMKGNLVNPAEPGLGEFYLNNFCFILMVHASTVSS